MRFYFNHTFSNSSNVELLNVFFEQLMLNYHSLTQRRELCINDGIITHIDPDSIISGQHTLRTLLKSITDKELKRKAYGWFTHYPDDQQAEYVLEKVYREYAEINYEYFIDNQNITHLLAPSRLDWPILSIPLNNIWSQFEIEAHCADPNGQSFIVKSFHGNDDDNFARMAQWLIDIKYRDIDTTQRIMANRKRLDKFRNILGKQTIMLSSQAEERFNNFTDTEKDFIEEIVLHAFRQQRLFPPKADNDLVKACKGKGNELTYELRHNQGIRLYFQCYGNTLIIGGIHTKAEGEGPEQSADINRATFQCNSLSKELH